MTVQPKQAELILQSMRQTTALQDQSAFFYLPREIRDYIYDLALGPESITLIGPDAFRFYITRKQEWPIKVRNAIGLPSYLLSCKRMCLEIMDSLGTYWAVRLTNLSQPGTSKELPNPLIFNQTVFKSLNYRHYYLIDGDIINLLPFIDRLYGENIELVVNLEHNPEYFSTYSGGIYNPTRFGEIWEDYWNGRFREVRIQFTVFGGGGEQEELLAPVEALRAMAEATAKRLVGPSGKVCSACFDEWTDKSFKGWVIVNRAFREFTSSERQQRDGRGPDL